jgi:SAM-dependent methyltransferase
MTAASLPRPVLAPPPARGFGRRLATAAGTAARAAQAGPDAGRLPTRWELFRLFWSEREHPDPFYGGLARLAVADFPFELAGCVVLDLGSGPGYYSERLAEAGARVVAVDLLSANAGSAAARGAQAVVADAGGLPLPAGSVDGVFCSNLLEHVPDPTRILDEIQRVLRPGGWAWVSWTNWYSPWGGHEISPLHLLGPRLGTRAWTRLFGTPRRNPPFDGLWPTYIGRCLHDVEARASLDLADAYPRYYPRQRWLLRVPGLRELATWNCVLCLRKRDDPSR